MKRAATRRPGGFPNQSGMYTVVVFILAAWWGIVPVLSPLHQALSSHQHRFDPVFQRFEDIQVKDGKRAGDGNRFPDSRGAGLARRSVPAVILTPCPDSNSFLHLSALSSRNTSVACQLSDERFDGGRQEEEHGLLSVLASAPKHSPPFSS